MIVLVLMFMLVVAVCPATADVSYQNPGLDPQQFYGAQGGVETIDDIHRVDDASISSVEFTYNDPGGGGSFAAEINIYANPQGLDTDMIMVGGPYVVSGLAVGVGTAEVVIPGGLAVGQDIWVGVRFTSMTAGLVLNDSPLVGTSHDKYIENGVVYWFGGSPVANFAITVNSLAGVSAVEQLPDAVPVARLFDNVPNPFNPSTRLSFELAAPAHARITVFDAVGRLVVTLINEKRGVGRHEVAWNGKNTVGQSVASGVYLYRLEAGGVVQTKRMTLVK